MRLLRVRVPDFRVLKDVDITFEKELSPSIFPLGSQNGGGKSTLLQLIFVLLHCSSEPERIPFLKNMINCLRIAKDNDRTELATIDIWNGAKIIRLDFFLCNISYVKQILNSNIVTDEQEYNFLEVQKEIKNIEKRLNYFNTEKNRITRELAKSKSNTEFEQFQAELEQLELIFASTKNEHNNLTNKLKSILESLKAKNYLYISNFSFEECENEENAIFCLINNLDTADPKLFLSELSKKIFLAAPSTQILLFLSKSTRKLLFKDINSSFNGSYYFKLKEGRDKLRGLFLYDFLAVDILIDSFKLARDKDFKEAIETGEYGNNYKLLLNELNLILGNKYLNLSADLSGVNFKIRRDNEYIELAPEDLSHGELKRLSIYMWLKYRNIEDAIVLMDEIEIAFHPDWQYQIVADLAQWAPSNQYILATHSFELCQALTPAHVKELEPKLLKQSSTQV